MPDCGQYDEAVLFSRYFYLKSTHGDMTLLPASLSRKGADYWILHLDKLKKPARLEDDGILKIGLPAKNSPQSPKSWDDFLLDENQEYTGCLDTPTVLPRIMVRLMRYIDRIKEQCTIRISNDCARVLFKLADENANQKLTPSEIKRTVASALLFAELAEKETLADKESEEIISIAKAHGEKIAQALLAAHDANKSKDLDYNEIAEKFSAPDLPIVKETLIKAGKLLPAFKLAAANLD